MKLIYNIKTDRLHRVRENGRETVCGIPFKPPTYHEPENWQESDADWLTTNHRVCGVCAKLP